MQKPTEYLLPGLAVFCAVLTCVLIGWSRNTSPPVLWEPVESASTAESHVPKLTDSTPAPESRSEPIAAPAETAAAPGMEEAAPNSATAPVAAASSDSMTSLSDNPPVAASPSPVPVAPTSAAVSPAAAPAIPDIEGPLPTSDPVAPAAPQTSPALVAPPVPQTALDPQAIARQPQLWPRQVLLQSPVRFPVFINGREVGNVQLPRGAAVLLRKVRLDGTVEIERQGSYANVPPQATDLVARVRQSLVTRPQASPAEPKKPGNAPSAAAAKAAPAAPTPSLGPDTAPTAEPQDATDTTGPAPLILPSSLDPAPASPAASPASAGN